MSLNVRFTANLNMILISTYVLCLPMLKMIKRTFYVFKNLRLCVTYVERVCRFGLKLNVHLSHVERKYRR